MPDTHLPDPGAFTCEGCGAQCCRHVTVSLERPTCKRDYDEILWFLMHRGVSVYVDDDNDWFVEFETECEALDGEICAAYESRPKLCADYDITSCVRFGEGPYYKVRWVNRGEFISWLEGKGIDWRYKRRPPGVQMRVPPLVKIKSA